jgi:7-dehydrocholesterol reductase
MPTIVVATNGDVEPPKSKPTSDRVSWGRTHKAKWYNNVVALLIVVAPLWMYLNWLTLEQYGGSAVRTAKAIRLNGLGRLARHHFPQPSLYATAGYALWLLFQAALYQFLPGKQGFGQRTPGGHLLNYTANGLTAWAITHLLFLTATVLGFLDPAIIAKNWSGIFIAANAYGFFLAFVSLIKGYFAPSYPEDVKLSGMSSNEPTNMLRC